MSHEPITISNQMPVPANSQTVPLIDTTYWNDTGPWASTATTPGPGKSRGQLGGCRVTGTITPGGQAATLRFLILSNPSGTTNAAFELDTNVSGTSSTGSVSVSSNATQPFSWLPPTPDWRIEVLAGGTAPTTLRSTLVITPLRTSGS